MKTDLTFSINVLLAFSFDWCDKFAKCRKSIAIKKRSKVEINAEWVCISYFFFFGKKEENFSVFFSFAFQNRFYVCRLCIGPIKSRAALKCPNCIVNTDKKVSFDNGFFSLFLLHSQKSYDSGNIGKNWDRVVGPPERLCIFRNST